VVAEAAVELADEVRGEGKLATVEGLLFESAQEVAYGTQLECALEGVLLLLAADPGGPKAEVAELAGRNGAFLPADFCGVEGEPGRRVCAKDAQKAIVFEAFFEIVAFGGGEVEAVEVISGGKGASRAHGYFALDQARSVGLAAGKLGAEVRLATDGYVRADARRPEDVPAHGATGVGSPDLTHEQPSVHSCHCARICPRRSKRFEFTIVPPPTYILPVRPTLDEAAAGSR
jgi:hypothetical protein